MSVSILILIGNWLLEGNFRDKFRILGSRVSILVFSGIILIHLLWLLNTSDFGYAFKDIRIKMPLLALPVIMGTSKPVTPAQLKIIVLFFIGSVLAGSIISTFILFGLTGVVVTDIRDISPFISHIRFSLSINVAIFSLGFLLYSKEKHFRRIESAFYTISLIWLVVFIFMLQSMTGIVIFLIVGFFSSVLFVRTLNDFILKYFLIILMFIIPLIIVAYISRAIVGFYRITETGRDDIELTTANGNPYFHDFNNKQVENGSYIWLYVCEKELAQEWNKRSTFSYSGKDMKDQEIKYTLIRYLTSRGLRKDSLGISRLSESDIKNIEDGVGNYIYALDKGLNQLLYGFIWQIDIYRKGGDPSGHSITQRLEYLKTAIQIIRQNFWFGVGTGDVQQTFDDQYIESNSMLSEKWRLRAHNQFVTFFISFGLFGFLFTVLTIFYPLVAERKYEDFFFMVFFLIAFLSMLNEDTLETHAGATFFSYFYSLFLFARNKKWFIMKGSIEKNSEQYGYG
ncbi:MAG: O-antigen ligase family protein [Bacteroidales bacterium]|nr:MAG: O-antigen ligase family protein [Bacteroidales bacterium]